MTAEIHSPKVFGSTRHDPVRAAAEIFKVCMASPLYTRLAVEQTVLMVFVVFYLICFFLSRPSIKGVYPMDSIRAARFSRESPNARQPHGPGFHLESHRPQHLDSPTATPDSHGDPPPERHGRQRRAGRGEGGVQLQ
ncbi:hypothetical protein K438DRAFT_1945818 [Mycena galopus ATCC 62051]|nr:hypothetical protein K438DRAFT_1945818 [Mycena galopus ATCC 62051]